MRVRVLTAVVGIAALIAASPVRAQETCQSWYDPITASIVTVCFGGGGEDPPPSSSCTSGAHLSFIVLEVSGPGACIGVPVYIDNCTG